MTDADLAWGLAGIESLRARAAVLVVVDVLSFSTCVDVAVARGAAVVPFAFGDPEAARAEARRIGAVAAVSRRELRAAGMGELYGLSPESLAEIPAGTQLLLPSPNGSRLSLAGGKTPMLAGCLRNARSVATAARRLAPSGTIGVIAAGERWPDGTLRPSLEDLLGAGAILDALDGRCAPDAAIARTAFRAARGDIPGAIRGSASGRELIGWGFAADVEMAAARDCSTAAPVLRDGAYRAE